MTRALGVWDLAISTPIGAQQVELRVWESGGTLEGTATGDQETVRLVAVAFDGVHLTWTQTIARPLRLTLAFDVTVDGDNLTGTSKAGRLPRSKVSGTRRSEA